MAIYELKLPAMGEGIIEATITKWYANEGEFVSPDDPILDIATDKVDSEITSPIEGVLLKKIFKEGDIPKIGEVIALIQINGQDTEEDTTVESEEISPLEENIIKEIPVPKINPNVPINKSLEFDYAKTISPLILSMAKARGISTYELKSIQGTGLNGRITKEDLSNYIKNGRIYLGKQSLAEEFMEEGLEKNIADFGDNYEVVEMSRRRKIISNNMTQSKHISPHVTSFLETDISPLVQWRTNHKDDFYTKTGLKLTYTPIIVEATALALKSFPQINASVYGTRIILKKEINIGVATALPDNTLIVPVIHNADKDNLLGIIHRLNDLANRARKNKLKPHEIKRGTFTLTNLGPYNSITGTPIINQPEIAILAIGAIQRKPAVVTENGQENIGIRDIMTLSLTYDHRIIDGASGGLFLKSVGDLLSNFNTNTSL